MLAQVHAGAQRVRSANLREIELNRLLPPVVARVERNRENHVAAPIRHARPDHARQQAIVGALLVEVGRQPDIGRLKRPRPKTLVVVLELRRIHRRVKYRRRIRCISPVERAADRRPDLVPVHQPRLRLISEPLRVFLEVALEPPEEKPVLAGRLEVNTIVPGLVVHVVRHSRGQIVIHRLPPRIARVARP